MNPWTKRARVSGDDGPASAPQSAAVAPQCPCVVKLLEDIGAAHAARMHAGAGGGVDGWKGHLHDEEQFYFPLLLLVATDFERAGDMPRAADLRAKVIRLRRDHATIRTYLAKGQLPPVALVTPHAALEDDLTRTYEHAIRAKHAARAARKRWAWAS